MLASLPAKLFGGTWTVTRMSAIAAARGTRIYRTVDWAGWLVLVGLAGVFLATGGSIRVALQHTHPVLGDSALALAGSLTLLWMGVYYSLRVSAHAVVSDEGIALVHGPVRHQIAWEEVARLSEWATLDEGFRSQWMAIWSTSGMRLQIRQDLVADFSTLRMDVLTHLAEPRTMPTTILDPQEPFGMMADPSSGLSAWGVVMVTCSMSGTLVLAFLHTIPWLGYVLLSVGGLILLGIAGALILRQRIIISERGVTAQRGPLRVVLNWEAVFALEREDGGDQPNLLTTIRRFALILLYRVDRRSGVVPAPTPSFGKITIRGGSGQVITIREQQYRHISWLRARIRIQIDHLRQTAGPLAPQIAPLPSNGSLAPETSLPPDPMAGASTLWLRESGEIDPFRGSD